MLDQIVSTSLLPTRGGCEIPGESVFIGSPTSPPPSCTVFLIQVPSERACFTSVDLDGRLIWAQLEL